MTEPDLFEGNDEVREAVCDWGGHDWIADGDAEICTQCAAARSVPALGDNHEATEETR